MSTAELTIDRQATYEALTRLYEAGRTQTAAFRKLTQRLAWLNCELCKPEPIPASWVE